ncbi:MAG TPA: transaldolase [Anaerolineaceae bacterium]|nr:transaldolase [Anaerolineaceae bacterium]
MSENMLLKLKDFGQSVWLDNISREILRNGEMKRMFDEDGITGFTSNPTIFQKAMASGDLYDADMEAYASVGMTTDQIFEKLAVADIKDGLDLLRPVYDRTEGRDGFGSMEVSPYLAHDTSGSIDQARHIFEIVDRPNLMVKIPAAPEGIPAIEELIAEGHNINVTLIFSLHAYEQVAEAYIKGLERFVAQGGDPSRVASVASFFVSRVDTLVDKKLAGRPEEEALRGKAGIANSKMAYSLFQHIFSGPRWEALAAHGARVQRVLWASTSTKDPRYPDTMYADALIGPDTVDTMPDQTVVAFRDHGHPALTITQGLDQAVKDVAALEAIGIHMKDVTQELLDAGIQSFSDSFDKLLADLSMKIVQA